MTDDVRLARALLMLRRRSGQTQTEAAKIAGVSRRTWARVEHEAAGTLTLDTVRSIFAPYGARVRVNAWWNGAELDRLVDEQHALLVERVMRILTDRGWLVSVEVTFSEYGERGSIDVLGYHVPSESGLVVEVKSAFGSMEETNRRLDVKARLAPKLILERFGSRPGTVSRLLILPEDRQVRRVADQYGLTLASVYPSRAREIRAWLRHPVGRINGLWFLTYGHDRARKW